MANDIDGVYADWGTPQQRLSTWSRQQLRALPFAAGSMGPKVEAAALFVEGTVNGPPSAPSPTSSRSSRVARAPKWSRTERQGKCLPVSC